MKGHEKNDRKGGVKFGGSDGGGGLVMGWGWWVGGERGGGSLSATVRRAPLGNLLTKT